MELQVIGIVGNRIYFGPFYAGDSHHDLVMNEWEKREFLEHGVKEFPNYGHIEAHMYGKTYEEFLEMCAEWDKQEEKRKNTIVPKNDSKLPF